MNKNNVFGVGILVIILMIVGGILLKVFVLDTPQAEEKKNGISIEQEGFLLEAKYKEENLWEYKITGDLPTPCHSTTHEVIVLESFPEQVNVNLSITPPAPDIICIQVIEELNLEGTFSASQEAKVDFIVSSQ